MNSCVDGLGMRSLLWHAAISLACDLCLLRLRVMDDGDCGVVSNRKCCGGWDPYVVGSRGCLTQTAGRDLIAGWSSVCSSNATRPARRWRMVERCFLLLDLVAIVVTVVVIASLMSLSGFAVRCCDFGRLEMVVCRGRSAL